MVRRHSSQILLVCRKSQSYELPPLAARSVDSMPSSGSQYLRSPMYDIFNTIGVRSNQGVQRLSTPDLRYITTTVSPISPEANSRPHPIVRTYNARRQPHLPPPLHTNSRILIAAAHPINLPPGRAHLLILPQISHLRSLCWRASLCGPKNRQSTGFSRDSVFSDFPLCHYAHPSRPTYPTPHTWLLVVLASTLPPRNLRLMICAGRTGRQGNLLDCA